MGEGRDSSVSPVASQRIADVIRERILAGEMPPGTRIKQDELADELATSRIPVREALRILDSLGLVTLRANSGAWVAAMSVRDLQMSYAVRERIEPLLLLDSLPNLTDDDVVRMRAVQDDIESNDDIERFLVLDRELHWLTYSRHQAPQLAGMVARLWDTTQHYRRAFVTMAGSQGSWTIQAEHRLLIAAISTGDADTAQSVLAMHIRRTSHELIRHPELFAPEGGSS
ncbi:MAG: GntR family transcriptional regulator [Aeromicrobium sp.]